MIPTLKLSCIQTPTLRSVNVMESNLSICWWFSQEMPIGYSRHITLIYLLNFVLSHSLWVFPESPSFSRCRNSLKLITHDHSAVLQPVCKGINKRSSIFPAILSFQIICFFATLITRTASFLGLDLYLIYYLYFFCKWNV